MTQVQNESERLAELLEKRSLFVAADRMRAQQARIAELEAQLAAVQQGVPVLYQFQDRDGKWCNFMHEEHYKNTVKDGSWPIRALYTHPTQHGLEQAIRALPRVSYGYKSDGESRYLQSYVSDDGPFLRYADVMAALAAQAKQGGVQ